MMKILLWLIATPFIALALFIAARYMFCGPNREVVKVAKPIAKIIADDIVKNGIPESLAYIEGLPYKLEGCKRERIFWKAKRPRQIVQYEKDADYVVISESCSFQKNDKTYNLNIRFTEQYQGDLKIYNSETYTGLDVSFNVNKDSNTYTYHSIGDGYAKHHGVLCSSFKQ